MGEVKPGWTKMKRDSMVTPGVTEVAFICAKRGESPWAVVADHTGVTVRGESPKFTQEGGMGLHDFAWILDQAMREYMALKRGRIQLVGDNEVNGLRLVPKT